MVRGVFAWREERGVLPCGFGRHVAVASFLFVEITVVVWYDKYGVVDKIAITSMDSL